MALRDDRSTARESWRDLVARIRAADEAAFEAMFRAYYDPLCRHVAPYVGSRDAAEDAVQGLFVRIWEDRARWVVSDLGHYLYTAVRRRAISQLRRMAVQRSEEHTSELQSPCNLVCRLLLEKKKNSDSHKTDSCNHLPILFILISF